MRDASVRLTLVSASPRRKELLAKLELEFDVAPSLAHEVWHAESPGELARVNAERKALASDFYGNHDRVLLGADTIIAMDEDVFGKPVGPDSARRMLQRLSHREHRVLTGLCLCGTDATGKLLVVTAFAESRVTFRPLTARDITTYLRSGEWRGKAGAYAVQGLAATFVANLSGDLDNVIGLPLTTLRGLLRQHFSHCTFR
ncbi:septum formation protein Maf [bacterium]|nr:septum formation protein Maf [bacterium]